LRSSTVTLKAPERFSGGLEMTGALLFGAVCGYIIALIFAPIPSTDEKDQIEKAQKDQKEQIEKDQKDQKEKIEKEQKEKSNNKGKSKQKEKLKQTDRSLSAVASKNEIHFCSNNCPDVWRLHRE
jgi:gas vesicle protein